MRILQVRFKNLNSLVGEWEIDLTHPAFASDGIFAIIGPTGAGKTTVLDAICLALYGRTPRLTKVNKSGNEIMSRQTGDCFAEVTFETQTGHYRCHWSQHRARKKPEGELQPPKHEIADADSGEIYETKIRGVAEQIETATGMDYDRFTRSMLLAQGGFSAFLLAPPDERAPILEQITGTEIYSQISIRVHERRSEEQKRLAELQAELAGMQLLSPEDEKQLEESLAHKVLSDTELSQQITEKNHAITWIEGITRHEEELEKLGQAKKALKVKIEAFAPDQLKLNAATRALELSADFAALEAIRKEQETDRGSLSECQKDLPQCTDTVKQAKGVMKTAAEQLKTKKEEQQKAQPVIRKVRELDLKIAEKDAPIKAVKDSIAELTKSLAELRAKQNKDSDELGRQYKASDELQQLLDTTIADEGLVENLGGTRGRIETLKGSQTQLVAKLDEITNTENQSQELLRAWQKQSADLESEKHGLNGMLVSLTEKQAELSKMLEDKDFAAWRKRQSLLTTQKDLILKTLEAVQTLSKSKQTTTELNNQQTNLRTDESALTTTLSSHTKRQIELEKELELLETQLTLLKRIEDLEEARHQLQDGTPCPLCGAKEHPFAQGNVPVPDETRNRLSQVRGDLKSVVGATSDVKVKLAKVGKDLEQVASSQKEHAERIEKANQLIDESCRDLPPDLRSTASDAEFEEKLKSLEADNTRQLVDTTSTLESAESVEKALGTLRETIEKAKDSVAKAERSVQTALHKKDSAEQLLERLKKEAEGYHDQLDKSLVQLRKEVQPFGIEMLSIDIVDEILEQLTSRRDQWVARQKEKTKLDKEIAALEIQTRHQSEQIKKSESELKKQQEQLNGLLREREALARERKEVFGDKKADDEESRILEAIDAADKALEEARQKLSTADQALSQQKSKINGLEKAIGARDIQLTLSAEAFLVRLKKADFPDEKAYKSACLTEKERKNLSQQSQKLSDEKTELTSRERELSKLIAAEREKQVTEESLDNLKKALEVLLDNQKVLQQEIGGIRQKLKDNESLKQQQLERVQAIDAQRRECSRWDLLHELIGSADGKKYRNFAQGLTFEMMVGHANRQLQKMTDRYLLIRDNAQPLELNVVDNYQAGEIRSTKNLSGGEGFIVSLSLALGLSHMASKNVRVDSLFLDEGFGTLDDEALDTALETLASLQQDGKLIGVISHVPALRERICTQIQVIPQTGGRSLISGPGCGVYKAPEEEPVEKVNQ